MKERKAIKGVETNATKIVALLKVQQREAWLTRRRVRYRALRVSRSAAQRERVLGYRRGGLASETPDQRVSRLELGRALAQLRLHQKRPDSVLHGRFWYPTAVCAQQISTINTWGDSAEMWVSWSHRKPTARIYLLIWRCWTLIQPYTQCTSKILGDLVACSSRSTISQ